jgi:hypothetical protein
MAGWVEEKVEMMENDGNIWNLSHRAATKNTF